MAKQVGRAGGSRGQIGSKEAFWREHVVQQPRSGLSIRAYCARHGLSQPSFYAWRSELARRDARRPRSATFVPVTIGPGVPSAIEFQVDQGLLIRVPAHDREALRVVWELVKGTPCSA